MRPFSKNWGGEEAPLPTPLDQYCTHNKTTLVSMMLTYMYLVKIEVMHNPIHLHGILLTTWYNYTPPSSLSTSLALNSS